MAFKKLIIGAITNYDFSQVQNWIRSIKRVTDDVDVVVLVLNGTYETVNKIVQEGAQVIAFGKDDEKGIVFNPNTGLHIVVERFFHIANFLSNNHYDYVITTDVKDVIFQKNPFDHMIPTLISYSKELLVTGESLKYMDEPWGRENMQASFGTYVYENIKHEEIINCGVLGGTGRALKDLALNIFLMSLNKSVHNPDQAALNVLMNMTAYKAITHKLQSENGYAAQLGTTMDPTKIAEFRSKLLGINPEPIFEDGKVMTSDGKVYSIVHQYDRCPELKRYYEQRYDDNNLDL